MHPIGLECTTSPSTYFLWMEDQKCCLSQSSFAILFSTLLTVAIKVAIVILKIVLCLFVDDPLNISNSAKILMFQNLPTLQWYMFCIIFSSIDFQYVGVLGRHLMILILLLKLSIQNSYTISQKLFPCWTNNKSNAYLNMIVLIYYYLLH